MQRKVLKLLFDVEQACLALENFSQGRTRADLDSDLMFRSAVERQFEIIGEALSQASHHDTTFAAHITDFTNIISFRHHLIHGYSMVDLDVVWFTLTNKLPILLAEIQALLKGTP